MENAELWRIPSCKPRVSLTQCSVYHLLLEIVLSWFCPKPLQSHVWRVNPRFTCGLINFVLPWFILCRWLGTQLSSEWLTPRLVGLCQCSVVTWNCFCVCSCQEGMQRFVPVFNTKLRLFLFCSCQEYMQRALWSPSCSACVSGMCFSWTWPMPSTAPSRPRLLTFAPMPFISDEKNASTTDWLWSRRVPKRYNGPDNDLGSAELSQCDEQCKAGHELV